MLAPQTILNDAGKIISITIPRPSNFHAHFRWEDEGLIDAVTPENTRHFKYVLAMPNTGPGEGNLIRSLEDANRVYHRIMDIRAKRGIQTFTKPLLTMYLTSDITPEVVEYISRSAIVYAVKSYPAHKAGQVGTTNSGHGVPFDECEDTIRAMEQHRIRLLIHAEDVTDENGNEIPHKDREAHCVKHRLWKFREKHPDLYICIEHASTREAVEFVKADTSGKTVMTVTPQHLLFTADDFEKYSWRNHLRCMPYVKTEADRQALLDFVTFGDPRCWAGDDTAPHASAKKNMEFEKAACGCWLPHSIALYAVAFMRRNAINENFVRFMSLNGPTWWHLEPPADGDTITIVEDSATDIPEPTPLPKVNDVIIPLGWSADPDKLKLGYSVALAT
jgi:dihydroorotase